MCRTGLIAAATAALIASLSAAQAAGALSLVGPQLYRAWGQTQPIYGYKLKSDNPNFLPCIGAPIEVKTSTLVQTGGSCGDTVASADNPLVVFSLKDIGGGKVSLMVLDSTNSAITGVGTTKVLSKTEVWQQFKSVQLANGAYAYASDDRHLEARVGF